MGWLKQMNVLHPSISCWMSVVSAAFKWVWSAFAHQSRWGQTFLWPCCVMSRQKNRRGHVVLHGFNDAFFSFVLYCDALGVQAVRREKDRNKWALMWLKISLNHRLVTHASFNNFFEIQYFIDLIGQGLSEIWSFSILYKTHCQTYVTKTQFVHIKRERSYSPHFTTLLTFIYSW